MIENKGAARTGMDSSAERKQFDKRKGNNS